MWPFELWTWSTMEISLAQDIMALCLTQTQEMAKAEAKRQQRAQRISHFFNSALARPEVAFLLGRFSGSRGARYLAQCSKLHGLHLRNAMQMLHKEALPEIYLCGGQSSRNTTAAVERYVPARREWEVLPPMPTARSFCCAASLGGKIYILGGEKDQRAAFAACECYDPVTDDWTRLPPMPTARAGAACAVAEKKLVVCGGLVMAWQVLDVVEAFDPEIGKWRRLPAMPTPRCGCCAVGVGSSVVVLGGQLANGTVLDKVEVLHFPDLHWDRLASMPSPRSGHGAATWRDRHGSDANHRTLIYVLGGLGGSGLTVPVVDRFCVEDNTWLPPFSTTLSRAGCAVVPVGQHIHVLGGFDSNRQDSDQHEVLNAQTGEVTLGLAMPSPRRLCCGASCVRWDIQRKKYRWWFQNRAKL